MQVATAVNFLRQVKHTQTHAHSHTCLMSFYCVVPAWIGVFMYMCTDVACKVVKAFDIQCGTYRAVCAHTELSDLFSSPRWHAHMHIQLIIVRSFSMKVIPNADEKISAVVLSFVEFLFFFLFCLYSLSLPSSFLYLALSPFVPTLFVWVLLCVCFSAVGQNHYYSK